MTQRTKSRLVTATTLGDSHAERIDFGDLPQGESVSTFAALTDVDLTGIQADDPLMWDGSAVVKDERARIGAYYACNVPGTLNIFYGGALQASLDVEGLGTNGVFAWRSGIDLNVAKDAFVIVTPGRYHVTVTAAAARHATLWYQLVTYGDPQNNGSVYTDVAPASILARPGPMAVYEDEIELAAAAELKVFIGAYGNASGDDTADIGQLGVTILLRYVGPATTP